MYDYAIIGAGPAGLTLAWYLAKYNKRILLIEKESSIGGCHRVRRVDGLFTEHGPRIVLNNYFSLIDILSQMNIRFDDLFTKYDYSVNVSVNKLLSLLSYGELLAFGYEFIKFMFNENISKNYTMTEFTKKYNFKKDSIDYINTICMLTDGGTVDNYTLYEFLQIFNQTFLYNTYQPKHPNDVGLFKIWQDALVKTNKVTIMFNTEILNINESKNSNINHIVAKENGQYIDIQAKQYIFAIPPMPMLNIIKNSSNQNMFGDFDKLTKWERDSRYLVYIPINFHWDTKVKLEHIPGITESDYGIVYMVMTDYMDFNDNRSKTVITCTVKITDRISSFNNLTANQCNEQELINEVFRQLKIYQPYLPKPTHGIVSPGIYKKNGVWETIDTAYFYTKAGYMSNKSSYKNLFWVGTHNGNSNYSFTAMETAIQNAIALLHEIEPQSKNEVLIHYPFTVRKLIGIILIIFILAICLIFKYKNKVKYI
ncbi:pyridine nucleotide-disulfide oxidoreductase class-II [Fadolivirus algeromassiliense]|jgi:hypothetical protein|uniref:Pyridine nucleotide-disulfide oxidoreductase class-II n=1 Tax=Fadolivirus FV1/VV64 TaxID=3070911 RepID=A0A7D3QVD2_9VIRU|nr:pyridine nucleotide-disulfide oxidoreductase class-II [Fadolivirus algeromassiliense]QKF93726.1 pyridine nucleotide-disulfide oxidoreductase class-II [Fadolivirus FV1/VV64]